jgi:hypothetical protein
LSKSFCFISLKHLYIAKIYHENILDYESNYA